MIKIDQNCKTLSKKYLYAHYCFTRTYVLAGVLESGLQMIEFGVVSMNIACHNFTQLKISMSRSFFTSTTKKFLITQKPLKNCPSFWCQKELYALVSS